MAVSSASPALLRSSRRSSYRLHVPGLCCASRSEQAERSSSMSFVLAAAYTSTAHSIVLRLSRLPLTMVPSAVLVLAAASNCSLAS